MNILYPYEKSYYVYLLKLALKRRGLYKGDFSDYFDEDLKRAVMRFQKEEGLSETGIINPATKLFLEPYLYGFTYYEIKERDTLYKIARKYNISLSSLFFANPDIDEKNIKIGDKITVPFPFTLSTFDIPYSSILLKYIVYGLIARYPFLKLSSIGYSNMNNPIYSLKIGNGEKEVFINASHHANEWITTPVLLRFLEKYSYSYINDLKINKESARELFKKTSLYTVLMVNPDGVNLVNKAIDKKSPFYSDALKTAKDYPDILFPEGWKANIKGVDLNLNYPALWENAKEIKYKEGYTSPAPKNFVGESPLSELESKAVYDFTKERNFLLTISCHTQGEVIYFKFLDKAPENSFKIAEIFAKVSGYKVEDVPLNSSYAGYKDFFILNYNLPGFTIEMGKGKNPLPIITLPKIYDENEKIFVEALILV